ncbi:hypothetical protein KBI52_04495 [Microvirga sp. HBU67558]|uniref:hypothetical protein n=1 Tax=Microvirga TaxID=186650 RepID=UPI001B3993D1|nr:MULTISPECIES: hypothetical protein [unclassified Microvirga]MBQ0819482.1 hypothetical protein [Microvirga sp. HBU67558]
MRGTIIALAAVLLFGVEPTQAAEGELYRCSARDVVTMTDDGVVDRFKNDFWKNWWTDILVDTATGMLRWKDGTAQQWVVLQQGSNADDFVMTPVKNFRSASTHVLRVRAWAEKSAVTFLIYDLSTLVTGRCESVR